MKSTSSSQVAIIDNFSSGSFTGTYSGSITAERYFDASLTYNQHYMGSPVNAPALSQFGASGTPGFVTRKTAVNLNWPTLLITVLYSACTNRMELHAL